MAAVKDPESGLEFYELSHPWGMYTPIFPGYEEIKLERLTYHAKHGVMTHKISTIFHTSTHVNAPIHLLPEAPAVCDAACFSESALSAAACLRSSTLALACALTSVFSASAAAVSPNCSRV